MKIYVEVQSDINNERMREYENRLIEQQQQQQIIEVPENKEIAE